MAKFAQRLPLPIIEALQKYYLHRRLQNEGKAKWDKTADLMMLDKILKSEAQEWGYSACAGTFWFTKSGTPQHMTITVTEKSLNEGKDLVIFWDDEDLKPPPKRVDDFNWKV